MTLFQRHKFSHRSSLADASPKVPAEDDQKDLATEEPEEDDCSQKDLFDDDDMSSVKTGASGTPQNSVKSRKRSYATIIEQQLEETAQLLRADSHQEESEEDAFGRSIAKASSPALNLCSY